jgi:hypothetical protein
MPAPADLPPNSGPVSAKSLLRQQFRLAHALLDDAIDRLPREALQRRRSGADVSPEVCYARIVLSEDLSVNGVLAAQKPLAFASWAQRTGLSEIPPLAGTIDWCAWEHRVRLDWTKLRRYAHAVYGSTDRYIAALTEDALTETHGEALVRLLSALLLSLSMRRGQIAALVAVTYGGNA